jgi:DNA-binding NarL/FixJ family response regulator
MVGPRPESPAARLVSRPLCRFSPIKSAYAQRVSAPPSRTLRVVVADDHPSIRENLRYLLNAELGLVVVGVAKDGRDALRVVHATRPDVLVVDSDMPDLKGLQVAEMLRSDETPIGIVLYTLDGDACIDPAASGVDACVTKDSPASFLIAAIHRAAEAQSTPSVESTTNS